MLTFLDADLEKLYVFARYLRRLLSVEREELPREIQRNIDMESYRIQQTGSGRVGRQPPRSSTPPNIVKVKQESIMLTSVTLGTRAYP